MGSHVVMGHLNLHRSNNCGVEFMNYLSILGKKHKLDHNNDISSDMDVFGYNARMVRGQPNRPGQDYINPHSLSDSGSESDTLQPSTSARVGEKRKMNSKNQSRKTPNLENNILNHLDDLGQGTYIPHILNPSGDSIIYLDGNMIDLASLSETDRQKAIKDWQMENLFTDGHDDKPAAGFIFGIQEPNYNEKSQKLGSAFKPSQRLQVLYDASSDPRPRAGILASSNLNLWMDTSYTNKDMCTARWNSGTEFGEIFIVSLYGEDNRKPGCENIVLQPTLIRFLKMCRRENKHFIIMADTNSWSPLWNMPLTDQNKYRPGWARGEKWEDALLDYNIKVLNVGDEWTYYKKDSTRDIDDPITSIIDVSFCSAGLDKLISNWLVRDAVPMSDHTSIEFCFHLHNNHLFDNKKEVYNLSKCNMYRFKKDMEEKVISNELLDPNWNYEKFQKAVNQFCKDITDILDDICPKKVIDQSQQFNPSQPWYNSDCKQWKNRISKIRSYIRRTKKHPIQRGQRPKFTNDDLKEAHFNHNKAMDKAKNEHRKKVLENTVSMSDLGKMSRSFKPKSNSEVNLFKKDDGTSMNATETVNKLCTVLFPDCRNAAEQEPITARREAELSTVSCNLDDDRADALSMEKLKAAIASFKNKKCPGSDGLTPLIFKSLGPRALKRLLDIYKASLLLGKLAKGWLEVQTIFIPKPGKSNYAEPRSFRPISLMQFMMKIMEKLLLWIHEENHGINHHKNQHGFRKGMDCDSNLTSFAGTIEKGLMDREFSVRVFVDIKQAFDHMTNLSIENSMVGANCSQAHMNWYLDFLNNRCIKVSYKGIDAQFWPSKGSPQGGISSPWLWNLIADELHEALGQIPGVDSEGFADDSVICATHSDPAIAVSNANAALKVIEEWAGKHSLELCADKTKAMLFTRRHERRVKANGKTWGSYDKPPPVVLMGKPIKWSEQHKHLGVTFKKDLTFTVHTKDRLKKAKGVTIGLKNSCGKLWGLKPASGLWMYRAVARAMLTHGCLVWHRVTEQSEISKDLWRFQKQGLQNLGVFRHSTPGNGLEIITNTTPLPLYIQMKAGISYLRTRGFEKHSEEEMDTLEPSYIGHRQAARQFLFENQVDFTNTQFDDIKKQFKWNNLYKVDSQSYSPNNKNMGKEIIDSDFNVYTDGSKQESGLSGAGLSAFKTVRETLPSGKQNEYQFNTYDACFHLCTSTILQCEMYAIKKAALWILENRERQNIASATICSDSQTALMILKSVVVKSSLVKETMESLNEVALSTNLKLRYVKAHDENNRGNDRADSLANRGADPEEGTLVNDLPKIPFSIVKSKIKKATDKRWAYRWQNNIGTKWNHRQTKDWFPKPRPKFAHQLLKSSDRITYSRKVHIITGHGPFNYHEDRCRPADGPGPFCDRCNVPFTKQTSKHILQECEVFAHLRHMIFHDAFPESMEKITDHMLTRFIKESNFKWFPFDDDPLEDPG